MENADTVDTFKYHTGNMLPRITTTWEGIMTRTFGTTERPDPLVHAMYDVCCQIHADMVANMGDDLTADNFVDAIGDFSETLGDPAIDWAAIDPDVFDAAAIEAANHII